MDGYSGPGGWSNIGMNPFASLQSRLKKALEADRKAPQAAAATQPAKAEPWDPFSTAKANRDHAVATQSRAEAMQRGYITRVAEPRTFGVDSKKRDSSSPRPAGAPAAVRPGQAPKAPVSHSAKPPGARTIRRAM